MECPSCNSSVADDAAVCPRCDAVLDPSLLDAAPPASDDDAPARPTPRPASRPATRSGARKGVKRPARGKRPAARPSSARSRMPDAPARVQRVEKVDWRQQLSQDDWNEMQQRDREPFVVDKGLDPDDVFNDVRGFFGLLSGTDKLAFFGAAAMLLSTFFPWKETATDGDVLGLLSAGIVVTLLSLLSLVAMVLRVRKASSVNPLLPWIVQLGGTGLGSLWCLVYVKTSWDSTLVRSPYGNFDMWASKPSFGVIFGFIAGVVGALGSVAGLKDMGGR